MGDDGGVFAFGDADDCKEEEDPSAVPDALMASLPQMDNVLGSLQKEPNKRNKTGRSMKEEVVSVLMYCIFLFYFYLYSVISVRALATG